MWRRQSEAVAAAEAAAAAQAAAELAAKADDGVPLGTPTAYLPQH
jgi:hypothetical protein